jgi:biopolymer transport protein ExbD
MTEVLVISKIKERLKLSSKDLFYIAIILGLMIALLYKITQTGFMKQEALLLEEKNTVLDTYLRKLDSDIKARQNQIANLDSTNQEQKEDLIEQLNFLKQKRREIVKLRKEKNVSYQKILNLTTAIAQQRATSGKLTKLKGELGLLKDSLSKLVNSDGDLEIPSWQYKFQNLQDSYQQITKENKNLKTKLSTLSGKVFATNINSQPGEILRGKFDRSTRARRTSIIQLKFKLTRVLQQKEKLIIRLFDKDQREFALRGDYVQELSRQGTIHKTIHLKPAKSRRFSRGKNTVKLFLAYNGETKPIGVHSVYLR